MSRVIIGIGSNINAIPNINLAISLFHQTQKVLGVSSLLKTAPLYDPTQKDFVNGGVLIETQDSPEDLKSWLQGVESKLGRSHQVKEGPWPLDLDILTWNGEVLDQKVEEVEFLKTIVEELEPYQ